MSSRLDLISDPEPVEQKVAKAREIKKQFADDLLAAFEGRIKRPRVSVFYQVGLLIVAILMVLLPLIYIGLIGVVIWGVYYHATHDYTMMTLSHNPKLMVLLVMAYAAPMVAGAILIFFMFKPLFARAALEFDSIEVKRDQEPLLFDFVDKICKTVRAAKPRRINLDCQVNASAGFDRGMWSFFRGKLVLTIGLPLVVGLSTRELAGVLAHEFGHFSQGVAMRLSYLIRSINHWFGRVVYERDTWDMWLIRKSEDEESHLMLILLFARLMVWLVRKILWVLMVIGHGISCFMLRQMEYNADQYEIRLAGSESFISTAKKLNILGLANEAAMHALEESWRERRLGDDVATLVVAKAREIPRDVVAKVVESLEERRTGLFDTHPSDRARIRRANKAKAPGVFRLKAAPRKMFRNYPALARLASVAFYRAALGERINPSQLTSTQDLQSGQEKLREERKALARFSQNVWGALHMPVLEQTLIPKPQNFQETARELTATRKQMKAAVPSMQQTAGMLEKEYDAAMHAKLALTLVKAGFRIAPQEFNLTDGSRQHIKGAIDQSEGYCLQYSDQLKPFDQWAQKRLSLALQLLHHPKVCEKMGEKHVDPSKAEELCHALAAVGRLQNLANTLRQESASLSILLSNFQGHENEESLHLAIRERIAACRRCMEQIRRSLDSHPYPFDHTNKQITLGRYIVSGLAEAGDGQIPAKANEALDAYYAVHFRLLGRLAQIAEDVETTIGLKSWAEPVQPPPEDDEDL